MIASLRGRLIAKDAQRAVVECGGVGYGISMSLSALARLGALGTEVQLVIYTHVGQDVLRLYGFLDDEERTTFETLIGISRVGPKLALAVLSAMSSHELIESVGCGDVAALARIPGVGKKTAERLLLELRDRLPRAVGTPRAASSGAMQADLVSALVNLGFKESVAQKAAEHARKLHPTEDDLATLVREALRSTTR